MLSAPSPATSSTLASVMISATRKLLPVQNLIKCISITLLFAFSCFSCSEVEVSESVPSAQLRSAPDGPAVVLIVIDTLRADSVSFSGSTPEASPRLASLARNGTLFRRAVATAP